MTEEGRRRMPTLTENKIEVPDGMLQAVQEGFHRAYSKGAQFGDFPEVCVMAALQWMIDNPEKSPFVRRDIFENNLSEGIKMDTKLQKIKEIMESE
jgi:hypothetical protein